MLKMKFTFDESNYRHAMNGHESVLHCHHYMSLVTKLAGDFKDVGGIMVMREVAEDTIRPLLDSYFKENRIQDTDERLQIGAEYYSVMGMGRMSITGSQSSGTVTLSNSHVDEGWIKKWGKSDHPVNYFTCGYASAVFAAAYSKPARSYLAEETASIVTGDENSIIQVQLARA